jgi:hypothetical protein
MSGTECDENTHIGFHQLGLEAEPAQSRQAHVEHEAARHIRALAVQKLLGRCLAAEACRAYTSASSAKCSPEALAASSWASASPALWV